MDLGRAPLNLVGAAILIGGTWWVKPAALDWWREGRPLAYGLLIIPGLVVTLLGAAVLYYLTSSLAVGIATVLLFPLLGVSALLGIGGARQVSASPASLQSPTSCGHGRRR